VVINFWEWNPTGRRGPSFSLPFACVVGGSLWYRIAPVPICKASTLSLNCQEGSGLTSTGAWVIVWMILFWASSCSGPHSKGTSLPVKHVIGAAIVEKFLTNMRW